MANEDNNSNISARTGAFHAFSDATNSLSALIRLLVFIFLFVIIFEYRNVAGPYLGKWLEGATHVTLFGISVERQLSAEKKLGEIVGRRDMLSETYRVNREYAYGAIVRASRNAPAIKNGRILWVDGHPENNRLEAELLGDLGIDVRRASNTEEALLLLPGFSPHLIISNIVREDVVKGPLVQCPGHYFSVPPGVTISLDSLNSDLSAGVGRATGFYMAEAISRKFPQYTNPAEPRIIYYSASNGTIASNRCARLVTNRADLLLQSIISVFEEQRWKELEQELSQTTAK